MTVFNGLVFIAFDDHTDLYEIPVTVNTNAIRFGMDNLYTLFIEDVDLNGITRRGWT